ncbi:UDP-glucose/GDP-mannose dehydrogenase family protein [Pseudolabrys sp. FHR47]|uniref:UDP-glucose dehydrogenase family protein n=1 Tax=Pseudolabrys sp. FHR47 TaxID=2562284 RepID=UPI0010BEDC23|nr:UDP-glucose/GDP-mannose dehydrogenase family protein [Pseudolabrys sp. FHR47]
MKVAVVGTGYVGLVTGACLASLGHHVVCVDRDQKRIDTVNAGQAPFHEDGLNALISQALADGRLTGTTDLRAALTDADVSIIAVGTPSTGGRIDLSAVEQAARDVGRLLPALGRYHTVVLKSTCVPGTADTMLRSVLERESGLTAGAFGLCMNPEFLREGAAVRDFLEADRIVIGAFDERSAAALQTLYSELDCPKLVTTLRNAEMIKYTANTLLATLISFSNEIAALCEAVPGLDERVVMEGVHLDRRLTPLVDGRPVRAGIQSYLRAGIGYGGSCFPKDTQALQEFARDAAVTTPLLDAVISTNDARAERILDIVARHTGELRGKRIALLGLAFKPGTDDVRESPGLRLGHLLVARGAQVVAWDPIAIEPARGVLPGSVEYTDDLDVALAGAEAALIATAWPQLAAYDWRQGIAQMAQPIIFDGRGILSSDSLPAGTLYLGVGRASKAAARP